MTRTESPKWLRDGVFSENNCTSEGSVEGGMAARVYAGRRLFMEYIRDTKASDAAGLITNSLDVPDHHRHLVTSFLSDPLNSVVVRPKEKLGVIEGLVYYIVSGKPAPISEAKLGEVVVEALDVEMLIERPKTKDRLVMPWIYQLIYPINVRRVGYQVPLVNPLEGECITQFCLTMDYFPGARRKDGRILVPTFRETNYISWSDTAQNWIYGEQVGLEFGRQVAHFAKLQAMVQAYRGGSPGLGKSS